MSYTALAPVVDYIAPAAAVTYAEQAPVAEHIAVTFTGGPVDECVAPARAILQHTVEQNIDVSVFQVVVIERIATQMVDVPMTIPQSEELDSLLYPGASSSSSRTPAPDEEVQQRIKLRQEIETAVAERAAQEPLLEEERVPKPASKRALKGKYKH